MITTNISYIGNTHPTPGIQCVCMRFHKEVHSEIRFSAVMSSSGGSSVVFRTCHHLPVDMVSCRGPESAYIAGLFLQVEAV